MDTESDWDKEPGAVFEVSRGDPGDCGHAVEGAPADMAAMPAGAVPPVTPLFWIRFQDPLDLNEPEGQVLFEWLKHMVTIDSSGESSVPAKFVLLLEDVQEAFVAVGMLERSFCHFNHIFYHLKFQLQFESLSLFLPLRMFFASLVWTYLDWA